MRGNETQRRESQNRSRKIIHLYLFSLREAAKAASLFFLRFSAPTRIEDDTIFRLPGERRFFIVRLLKHRNGRMKKICWQSVAERILNGSAVTRAEALAALESSNDELLELLDAAFKVRLAHFGRGVMLHVIRNAKSGGCSENCAFCAQSAAAEPPARKTPFQSAEEIVAGAEAAAAMNAARYCVVSSGRASRPEDIETVCRAAREIKARFALELCVSLGELKPEQAAALKQAGVDRYNHNLETSERFFPTICSTHTFADRMRTAKTAKAAGLDLCCGGVIGLGETLEDRVDLAFAVREAGADSIPVNLLDPRPGTPLMHAARMSPADALRALAMFRLVNPDREIRVAGGREACLGPMQPLALFPANSIFTQGYLTTPGQGYEADMAMLRAAGFEVASISE